MPERNQKKVSEKEKGSNKIQVTYVFTCGCKRPDFTLEAPRPSVSHRKRCPEHFAPVTLVLKKCAGHKNYNCDVIMKLKSRRIQQQRCDVCRSKWDREVHLDYYYNVRRAPKKARLPFEKIKELAVAVFVRAGYGRAEANSYVDRLAKGV